MDDPNPDARVHAPVGLRPLDRRGRHGLAAPQARHHPPGPREHHLRALPRGVRRLGRPPGAEGDHRRQAAQLQGGRRLEVSRDPLSRSYVGAALAASERKLANVDFTERGWHSLFNILTLPYLDRCDFNRSLTEQDVEFAFYALFTSNSCPEVRLAYTLKEVLSVWLKYPGKGINSFMGNGDLDFFHFLARAGAILPGFEQEKIKLVKTCLNPNSTVNPCPA